MEIDLSETHSSHDDGHAAYKANAQPILALLKSSSPPDEAKHVFGDVYLVSTKTALEKTLASSVGPNAFHVYVGYAGWGPGQLEREVDLGGWHIFAADAANVFHADPDSVWKRMIQRTETQIARMSPAAR